MSTRRDKQARRLKAWLANPQNRIPKPWTVRRLMGPAFGDGLPERIAPSGTYIDPPVIYPE